MHRPLQWRPLDDSTGEVHIPHWDRNLPPPEQTPPGRNMVLHRKWYYTPLPPRIQNDNCFCKHYLPLRSGKIVKVSPGGSYASNGDGGVSTVYEHKHFKQILLHEDWRPQDSHTDSYLVDRPRVLTSTWFDIFAPDVSGALKPRLYCASNVSECNRRRFLRWIQFATTIRENKATVQCEQQLKGPITLVENAQWLS